MGGAWGDMQVAPKINNEFGRGRHLSECNMALHIYYICFTAAWLLLYSSQTYANITLGCVKVLSTDKVVQQYGVMILLGETHGIFCLSLFS